MPIGTRLVQRPGNHPVHRTWPAQHAGCLLGAVRDRMHAAAAPPAERWAPMARDLDPRLVDQTDWPATAAMLQDIHDAGHDLPALTRQLLDQAPLGEAPARDLRYLLVGYLPEDEASVPASVSERLRRSAEQQRADSLTTEPRPGTGPSR